jgi:hypothetical protein
LPLLHVQSETNIVYWLEIWCTAVNIGKYRQPAVHDVFALVEHIFLQIIALKSAVIEVSQDVVLRRNFPFLTG